MSTTVFILGAGASAGAGVPVMKDFLDRARELWSQGLAEDATPSFATVFKAISDLQSVHSKAHLDIHNVETVFAAFEMARTLGTFADYDNEKIESLSDAMRKVIARTVELTLPLIGDGKNRRWPGIPKPYDAFADVIGQLEKKSAPSVNPAVLTFNYDMGVDYAFFRKGIPVDYGLEEEEGRRRVPLLKLHGSLNWAACKKCQKVIAWDLHDYFKTRSWDELERGTRALLKIGRELAESPEHCSGGMDPDPVLVPPIWNKTAYHHSISSVWKRAAKVLSQAERIFVIGYSMPESDAFFKHLYALGTVGEQILQRFQVIDPSVGTAERFRSILGPGAEARFEHAALDFKTSLMSTSIWTSLLQ
jgi:NAD-dependent SIR2 family protein deacetylase